MKRKDIELKELKREVELLRAQVKHFNNGKSVFEVRSTNSDKKIPTKHINVEANSQNLDVLLESNYIKSQLFKTFIFTFLSFAIIAGFYFYGFDKVINALNIQI